MTVTVSYQVIADMVGGTVPPQDVLACSISRHVGEIFQDLSASEAEFTLDNQNGDYSPDNHTGPYSLQLGGQIRIEAVTAAGSTYGLFNGFVRTFQSQSPLGQRQTVVRAQDVAQYLRRSVNTGLLLDTNTAELLSTVVSDMAIPSSMFVLDNKLIDVHPFAFIDDVSAGEAISKIVESGAHYSEVDGSGIFRVRNRDVDIQAATVASYENAGYNLAVALDDRWLMNDVRLRGNLRVPATTATSVSGLLNQTPIVPASSTYSFFLNYQDPATLETPLPVNSLTTTLTASTDFYVTNSAMSDITATTSYHITPFALSAKIDLFNGTGNPGTVQRLFLTGIPLVRASPFVTRAEDSASETAYGRRAFTLESELFEDLDFADAYSRFLKSRFSTPLAEITYAQRNNFPDVVQIDLLNTLHIVDSHTRINSTFLVLGIEHTIDFSQAGTVHTATYHLRLQQKKGYLILDDATYGLLGTAAIGF